MTEDLKLKQFYERTQRETFLYIWNFYLFGLHLFYRNNLTLNKILFWIQIFCFIGRKNTVIWNNIFR